MRHHWLIADFFLPTEVSSAILGVAINGISNLVVIC